MNAAASTVDHLSDWDKAHVLPHDYFGDRLGVGNIVLV